jgi:hypothetical protein
MRRLALERQLKRPPIESATIISVFSNAGCHSRSREAGEQLDDLLKKNARLRAEFDQVSHRDYRLFIYNEDGQMVEAPVISAVNYEEAAAKAEAIRGSSLAELLNVNTMRIVRHFPRIGK